MYYWKDILERNISELGKSFNINEDLIRQMNFFSTWWNNNLIMVIDGEGTNYHLRLIVYEMPYRKNGETKIHEVFEVFFIDWICPGDLYEAKRKAKDAEKSLRSDNPILGATIPKLNISYYDDYDGSIFPAFYGSWGSEKIKRIELRGSDLYAAQNSPDDYFKPLDIVKIFIPHSNGEWMVHTGIHLGSGKVCHLFVDKGKTEIADEDWSRFLNILKGDKKIIRYHPIIPLKHKDKIIEHVAKSITKRNGYSSYSKASSVSSEHNSEYNIINNNCEHMVNKCVLGIDFSELADRKNSKSSREINTQQNLDKTNEEFDKKYNYKGNISEIKGYGEQAFDVNRDGINMYDSFVEVQPKSSIFKDMIREHLYRQSQ